MVVGAMLPEPLLGTLSYFLSLLSRPSPVLRAPIDHGSHKLLLCLLLLLKVQ